MDEKLHKKVYDNSIDSSLIEPILSLYSFIVLLGVVFTNLPLFFEYSKIKSKPNVYSVESRKNIFWTWALPSCEFSMYDSNLNGILLSKNYFNLQSTKVNKRMVNILNGNKENDRTV